MNSEATTVAEGEEAPAVVEIINHEKSSEITGETEHAGPTSVATGPSRAHLWVKGKSGNPGGVAKVFRDLALHARTYTTEAIDSVVEIMRNKKEPAAARLRAAEILLDRGHGKAQQVLNVVQHLHGPELEEAARRILLKREKESAKMVEAKLEE